MTLYSITAKRRFLEAQIAKARATFRQIGRWYLQAFAKVLDGTGDPAAQRTYQIALARCRFQWHKLARQLQALGGGR